ncbi:MAG: hypothetical protein V9E87_02915 [Gemmatimonadales bacterium]
MQGGRLQQWSLPARRVLRGVAPHLLSGATFAAGALLLFSGATPAAPERLTGLDLRRRWASSKRRTCSPP